MAQHCAAPSLDSIARPFYDRLTYTAGSVDLPAIPCALRPPPRGDPQDARMIHILIVDAEEDLLWALSKNLFKDNPDVKVHTASTGEEALNLLKSQSVRLLITDTRVTGSVDGFNLILRAKDVVPEAALIVTTAFSTNAEAGFKPSLGVTHFINKPFDIQELRDLIGEVLDKGERFRGVLNDLELADILALLCLCDRTVLLHLNHRGRRGRFEVSEGRITHATFNDIVGPAAAWTMLGLQQGDIFMQGDFTPSAVSIERSWQSILAEAKAWLDENGLPEEFEPEVDIPIDGWEDDESIGKAAKAAFEEDDNPLGFSDDELAEMAIEPIELPAEHALDDIAEVHHEDTLPRGPLLRPTSHMGIQPASRVMESPKTEPLRQRPAQLGAAHQSLRNLLNSLRSDVPEFVAAGIVHIEEGVSAGGVVAPDSGIDADAFAAYYGQLVRNGLKGAGAFGESAALQTLQLTTATHYLLVRVVPGSPFAQIVMLRKDGNLGIARVVMRRLDAPLSAVLGH